jgi:glucose-1-phosphate adenylyltransferase
VVGEAPGSRLAHDEDMVLVGRDCVVDSPLGAGARLEPGTTA